MLQLQWRVRWRRRHRRRSMQITIIRNRTRRLLFCVSFSDSGRRGRRF